MPATTYTIDGKIPVVNNDIVLPTDEPVIRAQGEVIWINSRVLSQIANNKWVAISFNDGKFYINGKEHSSE
jgi:hypothetical protein